ncbi:uncharacterized protein AB675_3817 [Cyphellophora attinorum]|uniref:Uncharacterized protein n=1 Tax=Cyphellophora attinorum TaxID=1664694 RepID=A0A0N0NHS9_9EURO|nr:uncharacterized protein AB675_3817 [Phialophora attinorum]KPI34918.1 hypothetical protein AB675_3817 [Phialophora attinorum]
MRKAILLSVPVASAMIDWTPANLHLPASLASLLHPISKTDTKAVEDVVNAAWTKSQILSIEVEPVPADVRQLIDVDELQTEALVSGSEPGHAGKIEDANVDFLSRFIPPRPTVAKGDPNAPISSPTSVPDLERLIAGEVIATAATIDDSGLLADEYLPVTDNDSGDATTAPNDAGAASAKEGTADVPVAHDIASQLKEEIQTQRQQTSYSAGFADCFHSTLQYFYRPGSQDVHAETNDNLTNHNGPSTLHSFRKLVVPDSHFQWIVFGTSFTVTLLLLFLRALIIRQRNQRKCHNAATTDLEWSKLTIAGTEVGHVKRKTLRRGESVWVLVKDSVDGQERMEKVCLEDSVGVRGREVWSDAH